MKVLNYLLLFSYCLYIIFPVMILLHSAIKMMISTPTLLVFNKDKLTLSSPIKIFYLRWLNFNLLMLFLVCRIPCVLVDFWSRSKISYCWKKVMIILLISSYLSHNIWEEVQVKLKFAFVQWITWLLCNTTFVTQAVRRKKKKSCPGNNSCSCCQHQCCFLSRNVCAIYTVVGEPSRSLLSAALGVLALGKVDFCYRSFSKLLIAT